MIGTWLMLACVAAVLLLGVQAWRAWVWHHRGGGERAARMVHARMHRERVDSAEARLPESDFVRYHVASRPGATRYVIAALLLLLLGFAAYGWFAPDWPWN